MLHAVRIIHPPDARVLTDAAEKDCYETHYAR